MISLIWWISKQMEIVPLNFQKEEAGGLISNSLLPQFMLTKKANKNVRSLKMGCFYYKIPKNLINFSRVWLKMVINTIKNYYAEFPLFFQTTWVFCWPIIPQCELKIGRLKTSLDWAAFLHPKVHIFIHIWYPKAHVASKGFKVNILYPKA